MAVTKRTVLGMLGLAAAPIAAVDLTTPVVTGKTIYGFALKGGIEFAAVLRRLAEDIEAGRTHAQAVTVTSKASIEDFVEHTIAIDFIMDEAAPSA